MEANRIFSTIKHIYSKPRYLLINIIAIAIYLSAISYLIKIQEYGIFLVNISIYWFYALIITSSVALTIGIFSMRNTRNNEAKEVSTSVGTATALFGGVIGGCGCIEPLLLSVTAFGVSSTDAFALVGFVSNYQPWLFSLMIVINLFVIVYYLDKLSKPSCGIKKRKRK